MSVQRGFLNMNFDVSTALIHNFQRNAIYSFRVKKFHWCNRFLNMPCFNFLRFLTRCSVVQAWNSFRVKKFYWYRKVLIVLKTFHVSSLYDFRLVIFKLSLFIDLCLHHDHRHHHHRLSLMNSQLEKLINF